MSQEPEKLEEVRVLIADPLICADVAQVFQEAGVAAHGDYRDEPVEALIRDAFDEGVDYLVFMNVFHLVHNWDKRTIRDLVAKVYVRCESEVKTIAIGAAIKMVQQRRFM